MAWDDEPPAQTTTQSAPTSQTNASWDSTPPDQDSSSSYWGDVGKNAKEGLKEIPSGALQAVQTANKAMNLLDPMSLPKSAVQVAAGMPGSQTDFGQGLRGARDLVVGNARGLWQAAKDVGNAAYMPVQIFAQDKTPAETNFGQSFRQRPLSTTVNVATAVMGAKALFGRARPIAPVSEAPEAVAGGSTPTLGVPTGQDLPVMQPGLKTGDPHALFAYNDQFGPNMAPRSIYNVYGDPNHPALQARGWGSSVPAEDLQKAGIPITGREPRAANIEPIVPESTPTPQPPNMLETKGTQGLNAATGITNSTILRMTPRGQNPATYGAQLAKQFADEGAIRSTPGETWEGFNSNLKDAGKQVGTALDNIKKANRSLGVYPELEDSLKVNSVPVLKPIIDEANTMISKGYDASTGRLMKRMYDNLATQANANNGFLTLDMVKEEMGHVGKLFKTAAKDSDKYAQASKLYGTLHDIQDSMVNDIADRVSDPKLASNLKAANLRYSRYARAMPDVARNAAMSVTGQMRLGGFFEQLQHAILSSPHTARVVLKAGSMFKKPQ